MIEEQNPNNEQQHEESINFYAIFFKYLAYWPWFVASVIVCLILAFAYLRSSGTVYNRNLCRTHQGRRLQQARHGSCRRSPRGPCRV